jgi:hypothetical protein
MAKAMLDSLPLSWTYRIPMSFKFEDIAFLYTRKALQSSNSDTTYSGIKSLNLNYACTCSACQASNLTKQFIFEIQTT